MTFTTDKHLLAHEPQLFNDLPFLSQQVLAVDAATLTATTLTSPAADFEAAQVDAGHVILLNNLPLEVTARTDANTLEVSHLRADEQAPSIPPGDTAQAPLLVRTFAPQRQHAHESLMRLIGLDPNDPLAPDPQTALVSTELASQLESLAALERIFVAAQAVTGDNTAIKEKAEHYRAAFGRQLRQAVFLIDANGDGLPDIRIRPGVIALTRA